MHCTSGNAQHKALLPLKTLESEALRLTSLGYRVHPIATKGIHYRDQRGVEHVTNGKAPIIPGWQTRTLTREELLRYLRNSNVSGLGFRAGADIAVLDFDGEGHRGAYEYFLMEFPELEDAPLVRTGSGKEHLHIACPGMPESFTNQKFPRMDLKVVVELRGHRSNCVLPPTIHPETGHPYAWERDPEDCALPVIPFADLHGWLSEWAGVPKTTDKVCNSSDAKKVPIGSFACDFVLKGWRLGCPDGISQRHAALRTTRNLLSAGFSIAETYNCVWAGIEKSPWDPHKDPWTREEVRAIVEDLARRPAPPLRDREPFSSLGSVQQNSTGLRVVHVHNVVPRVRTVSAKEVRSWPR